MTKYCENMAQSLLLLNSTMSWVTVWYTGCSTCPLLHASVCTFIQNSPRLYLDIDDASMSSECAPQQTNNRTAFVPAAQGWHLSLLPLLLCNWGSLKQPADSSVLNKAGVFHPSCYLASSYANSDVRIYFPSTYLHCIDSLFARRGSYVKPGRLWLKINHIE